MSTHKSELASLKVSLEQQQSQRGEAQARETELSLQVDSQRQVYEERIAKLSSRLATLTAEVHSLQAENNSIQVPENGTVWQTSLLWGWLLISCVCPVGWPDIA